MNSYMNKKANEYLLQATSKKYKTFLLNEATTIPGVAFDILSLSLTQTDTGPKLSGADASFSQLLAILSYLSVMSLVPPILYIIPSK